jgi:hypothetical protein
VAYTPQVWVNGSTGGTPLSASRFNFMEAGIEDADVRINALENASATVQSNIQSGTTYTLALGDSGAVVEMTSSSANTITVPPNSSVAFPTGSFISLRQYGTGQTTIAPGAGVTIRSFSSAVKLAGQYAEATLTKRAINEWVLSGELTA